MRIALYRGTSFVGKLIRWQSRGCYSHASVILPDDSVIESKEFIGVRHLPHIISDPGEAVDQFTVATTPAQDLAIGVFLKAQLGKTYDYAAIARFITRKPQPTDDRDKWFCSELVFEAFRQAGIILLARTEAWEVSPSLLGKSPLLIASPD